MNKLESFKIGLKGLGSNKLRAALTMLGIIFGVASVIAMMSIGEGAKEETLKQIELMGTNNIIIKKTIPIKTENAKHLSFSPGLTLKDAKSIKEINPFVESITPERELKTQVLYKSILFETNLVGTTPNFPITFNTKISYGSFFKSFHINEYSNVCVIGPGIKEKLFKFENPLNKMIKVADIWFKIIGVTSSKNVSSTSISDLGIRNFNQDIYVPITTMMYKTEKFEAARTSNPQNQQDLLHVEKNSVDQLTVKINNSNQLQEAAVLIEKILKRKHYGVNDFEIILPEQLLAQKQKTQKIFNIVMGAIAGISLLVGGIGIMNIMLANLMERTREIGVRRAVGATKIDILNQFIFEALTISVSGGVFGIIVGFFLTSLISTYAEWKTIISPFSIMLAFIVSVATGLIFGIYPAKQAANKNPIDSLRYE